MTEARRHILDEIANTLGVDVDAVTNACHSITNTTELGLVAQQVRATRIVWDGNGLAVAPWVDRSGLDATTLQGLLAVARAGRPALLAACVSMVLGVV